MVRVQVVLERYRDFCIGMRVVWLDSAKGALILSSILGMLIMKKDVPLLFF